VKMISCRKLRPHFPAKMELADNEEQREFSAVVRDAS